MIWTRSKIQQPKLAAITAGVTCLSSTYMFLEHLREHDKRNISDLEVTTSKTNLLALSPPPFPHTTTTNSPQQQHHLKNIQNIGVTVLSEFLTNNQIDTWNSRTREHSQKILSNEKKQSNGAFVSRGRIHYELSKHKTPQYYNELSLLGLRKKESSSSLTEKNISSEYNNHTNESLCINNNLSQKNMLLPNIVESYFRHHNVQNYKLTQIQLLNANPGSQNQIWHRDNTKPGLTAIFSLCNVSTNGPTELLLKSQCTGIGQKRLWSPLFDEQLTEITSGNQQKCIPLAKGSLLACMNPGDVILYDSRILHRGRGYTNESASSSCIVRSNSTTIEGGLENNIHDRPVIVFRWDAVETQAPGGGFIVTTFNNIYGTILYAMFHIMSQMEDTSGVRSTNKKG